MGLLWKTYKAGYITQCVVWDQVCSTSLNFVKSKRARRCINAIDHINIHLLHGIQKHHDWPSWWNYLQSPECQLVNQQAMLAMAEEFGSKIQELTAQKDLANSTRDPAPPAWCDVRKAVR
jgi:hypothetical protein